MRPQLYCADCVRPADNAASKSPRKISNTPYSFVSETGVDYPGIKSSSEFLKFEIGTSELQSVSFKGLDDGCKKSVVINLYNLMIKHAFTKVGIPTDKENRGAFFTTVGYVFKDGFYSFDHLENGILRSNRNGILKVGDSRFATIFEDEKVKEMRGAISDE